MKKLMAMLLTLVCALGLAACSSKQDSTIYIDDKRYLDNTNKFAEYLDDINFVNGLSQSDFRAWLEKYSHNGSVVTDIVQSAHFDGSWGGRWSGSGDLFGFCNEYRVTDDKEYVNYSNSFFTKTPLDGFELPFGISFDDTLEMVLQKLEIDLDLQSAFVSEGDTVIITLYSDDHSSLQLINRKTIPETSGAQPYAYALEYTQNYKSARGDGKEVNVTRKMTMSFADDNKLGLLDLSVNETYKYK